MQRHFSLSSPVLAIAQPPQVQTPITTGASYSYMPSLSMIAELWETQLCQFVESISAPVAMLNRQFRYLVVSPRWLLDYQLSWEDVIGRSHDELFPDLKEQWEKIMTLGLTGEIQTWEIELLRCFNGNTYLVKGEIKPWYNSVGEVGGLMIFSEFLSYCQLSEAALHKAYDQLEKQFEKRSTELKYLNDTLLQEIRDRTQAEKTLRKHAQMLDLANDTIMILDLNYRITYWNSGAERLYDWHRAEALDQYVHTFLQTEFLQPIEEIKALLTQNGYWTGELIHSKRDGTRITVASRWTLQRDEMGNPCAILEINNDITRAKAAEEALRLKNQKLTQALRDLKTTQTQLIQTEKMSSLGQVVAGVAHEINNPVSFIYGNIKYASQYLQEMLHLLQLYGKYYPEPGPDIQAELENINLDFIKQDLPKMLDSMQVGAERISEIVRSLSNFARFNESEYKEVDIHAGIESTLVLLKHRLKAQPERGEITINKEYGNLPTVQCYPGHLNQVFMHILNNAIDALEEKIEIGDRQKPTISISTEVIAEEQVRIIITDNGPGIQENIKHRLFDPFFTTKEVGQGKGLGLATSYQIIVEKHGGKLECISQPGTGAQFIIEIPIQPKL